MGVSNMASSTRLFVGFTIQGLGWHWRWLHLTIILLLTVGHTLVHYLILLPGIGEAVEHIPFFNFHVLHEAEYMVAISYASVVFRLFGGILAIITFAVASIPFLLASKIDPGEYVEYGFTGPGNSLTEFLVLLVVAVFVVMLNELWGRERDRRIALYEQLESAQRQLRALNQAIQAQLTVIFESLAEAESIERMVGEAIVPDPIRQRITDFFRRVGNLGKPQI